MRVGSSFSVLGRESGVNRGSFVEVQQAVDCLKELLNMRQTVRFVGGSVGEAPGDLSLEELKGFVIYRVEKGNTFKQVFVNCSNGKHTIDQITYLIGHGVNRFPDWCIS